MVSGGFYGEAGRDAIEKTPFVYTAGAVRAKTGRQAL
jgi:hypothetical protein